MTPKPKRVFPLAGVIITMTVVLVFAETRHLHSSRGSSRHLDHQHRRANWYPVNKTEVLDHPDQHGRRLVQDELRSAARRKRQEQEDAYDWDEREIAEMQNTSLCHYRVRQDSSGIVHVDCVNANKIPCGYDDKVQMNSTKSYYCVQAYRFMDIWHNNTQTPTKIRIGCVCASDNKKLSSLPNARRTLNHTD